MSTTTVAPAAPAAPAASPAPASTGSTGGTEATASTSSVESSSQPATSSTGSEGGSESTQGHAESEPLKIKASASQEFFDSMSEADRARFDNGEFEIVPDEEEGIGDGDGDGLEKPAATEADKAPKEAPAEESEAMISAAEFQALPPKVQEALRKAQTVMEDKDYEAFQQSKDALDELLMDPVVQQRIDQRRRGDKLSFDPPAVFDKATVEALAQKAGIDLRKIDFAVDPEGSMERLSGVLGHAMQMGMDNGRTIQKLEVQKQQEVQARQKAYDDGFNELLEKIPGAKGTDYMKDPNSPLHGYYKYLADSLSSGKLNHDAVLEMGVVPMYMAWAQKNGKMQEMLHKPVANYRQKLFAEASKAATEAVVASATKVGASKPSGAMRHGIDSQKYLTDASYKARILEQYGENESVLNDLQILEIGGSW